MVILMISHLFFSPIFVLANLYLFLVYQKKIGLLFYLFYIYFKPIFKEDRTKWGIYLYFPLKSCKIDCFIPIFLWVAKAMTCSFAK